jgi:hypothetical protein
MRAQLRRTLRQVVELQRANQALEAAAARAAGQAPAAAAEEEGEEGEAGPRETTYLMQARRCALRETRPCCVGCRRLFAARLHAAGVFHLLVWRCGGFGGLSDAFRRGASVFALLPACPFGVWGNRYPLTANRQPPTTGRRQQLPQELVATKLELAELKELQLVTQRQLSRQVPIVEMSRSVSLSARSTGGASLGGRTASHLSLRSSVE